MHRTLLQIASGEVRHKRLTPAVHAFRYSAMFVRLAADAFEGRRFGNFIVGVNRPALMSVRLRDHGDGSGSLDWLRQMLAEAGLPTATRIWLQAFPRVLGYGFRPVSFWYCHGAGQRPFAIVAEVHNTFGERHCYLLADPAHAALRNGAPLECIKAFHVSPFNSVSGRYRFRFIERGDQSCARIDLEDGGRTVLETSISGRLVPLTTGAALLRLLRHPAFTLGVIARIHWQALRLWLRRVPYFGKPDAPATFVTRGTP